MTPRPHIHRPLAFTLVELLVVIGVIAILVSMLMPVLNKVRDTARRSVCLSNLRQIGIAAQMYFGANKGAFPVGHTYKADGSVLTPGGDSAFAINALSFTMTGKWPNPNFEGYESPPGSDNWIIINPTGGLVHPAFNCPNGNGRSADLEMHNSRMSYGMNNGSNGWSQRLNPSGPAGLKSNHVRGSSNKVYAMDWPAQSINPGNNEMFNRSVISTNWFDFVPGAGAHGVTKSPTLQVAPYPPHYDYSFHYADLNAGRHDTPKSGLKVNVLYCDGHAETKTSAEITKTYHFPGLPPTTKLKAAPNNMFNLVMP